MVLTNSLVVTHCTHRCCDDTGVLSLSLHQSVRVCLILCLHAGRQSWTQVVTQSRVSPHSWTPCLKIKVKVTVNTRNTFLWLISVADEYTWWSGDYSGQQDAVCVWVCLEIRQLVMPTAMWLVDVKMYQALAGWMTLSWIDSLFVFVFSWDLKYRISSLKCLFNSYKMLIIYTFY